MYSHSRGGDHGDTEPAGTITGHRAAPLDRDVSVMARELGSRH